MTLDLRLPWQPVTHGGRTPIVTCWRCRYVFRCGDCARAEL
jgi:hypothetical protein